MGMQNSAIWQMMVGNVWVVGVVVMLVMFVAMMC